MAQLSCGGCFKTAANSEGRTQTSSLSCTVNKHPKEAMEIMNIFRQKDILCDVTLIADAEKVHAHKLVLCAASPYFKAMFGTSGMKESEMKSVSLQGISASILGTLVDFAYTSEIMVTEQNVCALLPAATMFQMAHVIDACCTFLEHQLDPSNCIGIADFAQAYGCNELYNKARVFIYKNFSQVSKHEEFMQLGATQLIQVIKRDELNVRCESEVFNAALSWVAHDEKRQNRLEQLLSAVRCHFLTPCFLEKQLNDSELLQRLPSCQRYLEGILNDLTLHNRCAVARRKPSAPPVMYSIGGYLRQSLSNCECFNPESKDWTRLKDLPVPRSGVAAVAIHGLLYVIGGRNNSPHGNEDSASVDCYDPFKNSWSQLSPMLMARNRVGAGNIDGMLYAIGGSQAGTHHNSVERYDPTEDKWTMLASMATKRIGVGVATVNRLLYAIGGYDGQNRLKSCEVYHPEKNEWADIPPMHTTRSGAGVGALDQVIYVAGGYDSANQLDTVERFDVQTQQWEFVAPLRRPRSALALATVANKIFALGGYDGNDFLSTVESYDVDEDTWTEVTSMSCGRSGHGCAVTIEPCIS